MLPTNIETDQAWDAWEEQLLRCNQEDLVQFMMARMSQDDRFMQLVAARFGTEKHETASAECDLAIADYCSQVKEEMKEMVPDVDYLISFTERFFQVIEGMQSTADRLRAYDVIIRQLTDAIAGGAGRFHEEYELLEDEIEDAKKKRAAATQNGVNRTI